MIRALALFLPFRLLAAMSTLVTVLAASGPTRAAEDPEALRDEAFQAAQWALATSAGAALAQLGVRFAAGDGALARLVRERQDLVETWRAKDRRVLQLLGRSGHDAEAEAARLRGDLDDLARRIAEADATLEKRFPAYAALANPRPLSETETRRLLKPDEALVLFLVSEAESWVFAVSPRASDWIRVPIGAVELDERVRRLRRTLAPDGSSRAAESAFGEATQEGRPGFDRTTAHELHRLFLEPLSPVLGQAAQWIVVADGAFTSLPLAVLPTAAPQGDDADPEALAATPWLIRSHALTTLPAVSSLRALRAFAPRPPGSEPFRGFGAPVLGGKGGGERGVSGYFRGARADVEAVRGLAPLPATEIELKRLAAALEAGDGAITLGPAATETAVKRADLTRARILAFATHGLVSGELAGLAEPALVFTPPAEASDLDDGLLTASEAAELKLSADWVVLSACNTAAGDGSPGAEGLSGLARAFLYAGARAILVSHWPVGDEAAAEITTRTFANLTATPQIGRAEALRRALSAMIDRDDRKFAHPSAWAPFVVVGDGR
jgi:CHAT domain-containing protein